MVKRVRYTKVPLTTLFYFTTIKMKYLTTLTILFIFTNYAHHAVFLHYC